ncbi:thrombospondin-1-like [Crassostrea virginica]
MVHMLASSAWCLLWLWISIVLDQYRVRGAWSAWTDWSACCLNKQSRFRTCNTSGSGPNQMAPHCVGNSKLFRHCWGCPDQKLAPRISPWSVCSVTCGEGQMTRTVSCDLTEEQMIQYKCQAQIAYVVTCQRTLCQVDEHWSQWSTWGNCEPSGGKEGVSNRTRACGRLSVSNGNKKCPGSSVESKTCVLCRDDTNSGQVFTELPQSPHKQHGASREDEAEPYQRNSAASNSFLVPSIVGSVGFIIAVLTVTAFVFRYLEKRRLRTTLYRMKKLRFEGDIKTIVLFPDSRNPFES